MKTLQSSVEELQMGQTRLRMDFDEQRMERVSSPSYLQHPIRPEVGAVIYDTSSLQKSFQLPANGKNSYIYNNYMLNNYIDCMRFLELVGDRKPLQKSATTTLVGENRFPTTQRPSIPQGSNSVILIHVLYSLI
jgi:hypothetical protein